MKFTTDHMKIVRENNFTVTLGSLLRVSKCSLKGSETEQHLQNQQFDDMHIIKPATPTS